jgi:hypothetical protein
VKPDLASESTGSLQRTGAELPCSPACLHAVFLFFFVLFLIVGVALTCVGFLEYDPIEPGRHCSNLGEATLNF